jgi:hypothetical protein
VRYAVAITVGALATAVVEKPVLRLRDRILPARDGRRGSPAPAVRTAPRAAITRQQPAPATA